MTVSDAYEFINGNRVASVETVLAMSKIFDAIRSGEYMLIKASDLLNKNPEELYSRIYSSDTPNVIAERIYQMCDEDELKEVYKQIGEYIEEIEE